MDSTYERAVIAEPLYILLGDKVASNDEIQDTMIVMCFPGSRAFILYILYQSDVEALLYIVTMGRSGV